MRNEPAFAKLLILPVLALALLAGAYFFVQKPGENLKSEPVSGETPTETSPFEDTAELLPPPTPIPAAKTLVSDYHVYQTFNNCGPASLSMTLSYFGINVSQKVLGGQLRPYQNPQGDNDDKAVTLQEIGIKAEEYGLLYYLRPMGTPELIKQFIFNDIPVIALTWLKEGEYIGHFRIIKGYDDNLGVFIQDDSYQGKNLEYSYGDFNRLWSAFNYQYIVLVEPAQKEIAEKILGENLDEKVAWESAKEESESKLEPSPESIYDRFNLSVANYYLENYEGAVETYESVSGRLPFRMLWYQIEPILSYEKLGDDERVLEITGNVLNNENRAFSELYQIRGRIFMKQGDLDAAREEFEKALYYNENYVLSDEELALLD